MNKNNYTMRGEWLHGLSFKKDDAVLYGTCAYVAKSDRPCYDDPPDVNDEYELIPFTSLLSDDDISFLRRSLDRP